jgi:hypothetical protein
MLSRAVNGFTEAQVNAALRGVLRPPQYRVRAELYNHKNEFLEAFRSLILDGSEINHVRGNQIKRYGRFNILELRLALDAYHTQVIDSDPLFYWRLGETSGATATDASSNGRNGTYNGGVTYSVASLLLGATDNTGVTLNGSTGFVSITDAGWMDVSAISGVIWLKGTGVSRALIDRDDGSSNRFFRFAIDSSGNLALTLTFTSGSPTTKTFTATGKVNDGSEHMCWFTYDGMFVRIGVGTKLLHKEAETRTLATGTLGIRVGATNAGTLFNNGTLDEAALWNRALSSNELRRMAKKGIGKLAEVDYTDDRLKIYYGVKMDSNGTDGTPWAEWPQGLFLFGKPRRKSTKEGIQVSVDVFDQTKQLVDRTVSGNRYIVSSGTNYITAITAAMVAAGFETSQFVFTATSLTLPEAREWAIGASYEKIVNDLLYEINYKPIRFNGEGQAIAEPYVLEGARASEYTYETDSLSVIGVGAEEEVRPLKIPNTVTLTQANPGSPTIESTSQNENIESNSSVPQQGTVQDPVRPVNAANQTILDALADRELTEGTETSLINLRLLPHPFHDDSDIFLLRHTGINHALDIDGKYMDIERRLPLKEGEQMEVIGKEVVNVA